MCLVLGKVAKAAPDDSEGIGHNIFRIRELCRAPASVREHCVEVRLEQRREDCVLL